MPAGPLAGYCAVAPQPDHGVLIFPGVALIVELLSQQTGGPATWDGAIWDTDTWQAPFYIWVDVTDRCESIHLTRGRISPGDRFRVAGGSVVFDNSDGAMDPLATTGPFIDPHGVSMIAPGALLRVGARTGGPNGVWHPWITGGVEAWNPTHAPFIAEPIEAVVSDTFTDLAAIDDPPLPSPVGANEGAGLRLDRLLTAAAWRFGVQLDAGRTLLQATTMDAPRLQECYLTADSDGGAFLALGNGTARFVQRAAAYGGQSWWFGDICQGQELPYAGLVAACDDSRMLNVAHVGQVGGPVMSQIDSHSMNRYGTRSAGMGFPRTDLIYVDPNYGQQLANDAITRFANQVNRIDSMLLDANNHPALPNAMCSMLLGDRALIGRTVQGVHGAQLYQVGGLDYTLSPHGPVTVFTLGVNWEAPWP